MLLISFVEPLIFIIRQCFVGSLEGWRRRAIRPSGCFHTRGRPGSTGPRCDGTSQDTPGSGVIVVVGSEDESLLGIVSIIFRQNQVTLLDSVPGQSNIICNSLRFPSRLFNSIQLVRLFLLIYFFICSFSPY